jgi:hypothetical protein
MTALIKALCERREELPNELQDQRSFQRPWRGVRVEGVADAVRLTQRRSERWHEKDSCRLRRLGRTQAGSCSSRRHPAPRASLRPAT